MNDSRKSKAELIVELEDLRKRLGKSEAIETLRLNDRPIRPPKLTLVSGVNKTDGVAKRQKTGLIWPNKDQIPVVVLFVDKSEQMHLIHPTSLDWWEMERHDSNGKQIKEVFRDAVYETILPRVQAALAGEEQFFEFEVPNTDGDTRILQAHYVPQTDESETVFGFNATILDITNLKQSEIYLRESESRYRELVEGSIQGIVIHKAFKPLFANQAYAEIFGLASPEEVLELESLMELVPLHERERMRNVANERMRREIPAGRYEADGLRKDGTLINLVAIQHKVFWQGSDAIQTTLVEITERKQAEAELQSSRQLLQTVFDSLAVGVFVKDVDSRHLMVNSAHAEMCDIPKSDWRGTIFRREERSGIHTRPGLPAQISTIIF